MIFRSSSMAFDGIMKLWDIFLSTMFSFAKEQTNQKQAPSATKQGNIMQTKMVNISEIYADLDFNSRKLFEGIPALAEDMGNNGQLVPLLATSKKIEKDNKGKGKHFSYEEWVEVGKTLRKFRKQQLKLGAGV